MGKTTVSKKRVLSPARSASTDEQEDASQDECEVLHVTERRSKHRQDGRGGRSLKAHGKAPSSSPPAKKLKATPVASSQRRKTEARNLQAEFRYVSLHHRYFMLRFIEVCIFENPRFASFAAAVHSSKADMDTFLKRPRKPCRR